MGMKLFKFSILECLSFMLGFTCILEAIRMQAGPIKLNISDLFFVLLFFYVLTLKHKKAVGLGKPVMQVKSFFIIILVFCLNFISPIVDNILFPTGIEGVSPALAYAIKTAFNLVFFYEIFSLNGVSREKFLNSFCKGFVFGIAFHILYSLYQLVAWYVFGEDIHTPLMESFGITEDFLGGHPVLNFVFRPLVIRTAGLFWDPYFIGIMGCVAIFLSLTLSNKVQRGVAVITSFLVFFMSFSRTGYLAFAAVLFLIPVIAKRSGSFGSKLNIGKLLKLLLIVIITGAVLVPLFIDKETKDEISQGLKYKTEIKVDDEGDMRHMMYPVYAVEAVLHDPLHLLFGYGARNSSRGIYISGNIPQETKTEVSYDIESDWCKFLINYGIICFFIYIVFNIMLIKLLIRRGHFDESFVPLFLLITILATFISGFFYTINDSRWVWLVYAAAIVYLMNENEKEKQCVIYKWSLFDTTADWC